MATTQRGITLDDRAFLQGLASAGEEMKAEGEVYVHEIGDGVARIAKDLAAKHSGHLEASIGVWLSGIDKTGPWLDVGTHLRYALFVEYGTYKDRAQPFMRPALKMAAAARGQKAPRSVRSVALSRRATKRAIIRRAMKSGVVSPFQARTLSRAISSKFRTRAPRRRRA